MRASGRGGRQGPRGDRLPRGPLLRLWACARGPLPRSGGMLRAGPFRAWRTSCARNLYMFRGNSAHAALFRVLGRVSLE